MIDYDYEKDTVLQRFELEEDMRETVFNLQDHLKHIDKAEAKVWRKVHLAMVGLADYYDSKKGFKGWEH